jgi:hypothetical protein
MRYAQNQDVTGITFIRYTQNRKIGKPNNLEFWEQQNQRPKQDNQNRPRSSMAEGGERSPSVFSGIRVTRSLALCVCFVDLCLSPCPFSFDLCVVCSSSIYGL